MVKQVTILFLYPKSQVDILSFFLQLCRTRKIGWKLDNEVQIKKRPEQSTAAPEKTPIETMLRICPTCKKGKLVTIAVFDKRGPPEEYKNNFQKPATLL